MHLLGGLAPVDALHAAVQQGGIGGFLIILGLGHSGASLNFIDDLQEQLRTLGF